MIRPPDAWVLARLLADQPLNGEVAALPEPWKAIGEHLAARSVKSRQADWKAMLAARPDRHELLKAMAAINPVAPQPAIARPQFATVADVRKIMAGVRWHWPGWIPAARVEGLAALEGIGKTRAAMDLCRRVYLGKAWPDFQPMTLPPGTPSLWLCADGQHDEIADMLPPFGLPDEAVVFPAPSDDPYNNTSLDDPETLSRIDAAIIAHKPWAVFVDSLTYATSRDLCEQRSIAILKTPLVDLVQRHQINLILLLHDSASGQALGKRIKGVTRTLLHLECPDPERPERLRLWVEKTYSKKPPPLGVTMGDDGNTYDPNPPDRPDPSRGGRPPEMRGKAMQFIRDALAEQNDRIGNELCSEWVKEGGSPKTFWRAADDLSDAGEIVVDGGPGTRKQKVLHLPAAPDKTQSP